jgi:hypothetical protein
MHVREAERHPTQQGMKQETEKQYQTLFNFLILNILILRYEAFVQLLNITNSV